MTLLLIGRRIAHLCEICCLLKLSTHKYRVVRLSFTMLLYTLPHRAWPMISPAYPLGKRGFESTGRV